MVSLPRALSLSFWVAGAFFPVTTLASGVSGPLWALYLVLAAVAGTYLAARTDHSSDRVFAFALTTVATYLVAGLALGYPVNEPPVPVGVLVPFWALGLAVGYTVWLGDGVERVRERLTRRPSE